MGETRMVGRQNALPCHPGPANARSPAAPLSGYRRVFCSAVSSASASKVSMLPTKAGLTLACGACSFSCWWVASSQFSLSADRIGPQARFGENTSRSFCGGATETEG